MDIQQKSIFGLERKIELKDDRYLFVEENKRGKEHKYQVDLLAFSSDSYLKFSASWRWLVLLVLMLVSWSVLAKLGSVKPYMNFVDIGMWLMTFLLLLVFVAKLRLERVFVSRRARVPLLHIFIARPSFQHYTKFIDELEKQVKRLTQSMKLPADKLRAGELKTLRRLVDENVVSKKEYERAKPRLLR